MSTFSISIHIMSVSRIVTAWRQCSRPTHRHTRYCRWQTSVKTIKITLGPNL